MPSTIISRKKLQSVLQSVSSFSSPKIDLEQYPTSPHVAATCPSYVISVDVDPDAISDFVDNLDSLEMRDEAMDAVLCDVTRFGLENDRKLVDTVILNPPFGTNRSNTGIDIEFLKRALYIAEFHVYSLHKTSTRDFVLRTIRDQKAKAEVVAELRFDIPRMYKRHRQESVDIEVDLVHAWY
ncbi:Methyltransferase [Fasciola hepatica]|uniref:Methyltransferase n=1 Tax=Fasciola hepatica TaxID=6192 RepID=A0A4E0R0Z7_FASHE|nr:Methyltransferase [Fasciola hepatica]